MCTKRIQMTIKHKEYNFFNLLCPANAQVRPSCCSWSHCCVLLFSVLAALPSVTTMSTRHSVSQISVLGRYEWPWYHVTTVINHLVGLTLIRTAALPCFKCFSAAIYCELLQHIVPKHSQPSKQYLFKCV